MLKICSNCKSSDGSSPSASPTCPWRQLIVHTQLPTLRHALFYFLCHLQIEWQETSNTQKSILTCGLSACCWLFQFWAIWLMPCKLISSSLLSGRTDSAHQKALEMETSPYRYLWRGCASRACIPKEPSGPQHGLHTNIGLAGPEIPLWGWANKKERGR